MAQKVTLKADNLGVDAVLVFCLSLTKDPATCGTPIIWQKYDIQACKPFTEEVSFPGGRVRLGVGVCDSLKASRGVVEALESTEVPLGQFTTLTFRKSNVSGYSLSDPDIGTQNSIRIENNTKSEASVGFGYFGTSGLTVVSLYQGVGYNEIREIRNPSLNLRAYICRASPDLAFQKSQRLEAHHLAALGKPIWETEVGSIRKQTVGSITWNDTLQTFGFDIQESYEKVYSATLAFDVGALEEVVKNIKAISRSLSSGSTAYRLHSTQIIETVGGIEATLNLSFAGQSHQDAGNALLKALGSDSHVHLKSQNGFRRLETSDINDHFWVLVNFGSSAWTNIQELPTTIHAPAHF